MCTLYAQLHTRNMSTQEMLHDAELQQLPPPPMAVRWGNIAVKVCLVPLHIHHYNYHHHHRHIPGHRHRHHLAHYGARNSMACLLDSQQCIAYQQHIGLSHGQCGCPFADFILVTKFGSTQHDAGGVEGTPVSHGTIHVGVMVVVKPMHSHMNHTIHCKQMSTIRVLIQSGVVAQVLFHQDGQPGIPGISAVSHTAW